jgi:hypothetical protein
MIIDFEIKKSCESYADPESGTADILSGKTYPKAKHSQGQTWV